MQLALSAPSMPPLVSVWVELSANSRQGFTKKNPAWRPAPNVVNSTTAIGLRAGLFLEGVRKSHCARYYNPITGTFVSRDPEDGIILDPRTLHKYMYAGGDPVNLADPTGRFETAAKPYSPGVLEYALVISVISLQAARSAPLLTQGIRNMYAYASSIIDCINQYIKDLQLCYEAYKNDPAKLARCYAAAKAKKDLCLGKTGPIQ